MKFLMKSQMKFQMKSQNEILNEIQDEIINEIPMEILKTQKSKPNPMQFQLSIAKSK